MTDPKTLLTGLRAVRKQAQVDFNWGLRWGRLEKLGFIWKYGNPWNYPALEFEELKTLTTAFFVSEDLHKEKAKKGPSVEVPESVKQQRILAAKGFHQAMRNG